MDSKGLTQQQVADQAGVSQNAVFKWLHGSVPSLVELSSIAEANGVSVQGFLNGLEVNPSPEKKNKVLLDIAPAFSQDAAVYKQYRSLAELLADVRRLTKARGKKVELARIAGVTRQAVDQWLSGSAKPSSETTFALLNWVRKQSGN